MYVFKRGDYYKYEYSTDTSISTEGWVFASKIGILSISYALHLVLGWTLYFLNLLKVSQSMTLNVDGCENDRETWPTCTVKIK